MWHHFQLILCDIIFSLLQRNSIAEVLSNISQNLTNLLKTVKILLRTCRNTDKNCQNYRNTYKTNFNLMGCSEESIHRTKPTAILWTVERNHFLGSNLWQSLGLFRWSNFLGHTSRNPLGQFRKTDFLGQPYCYTKPIFHHYHRPSSEAKLQTIKSSPPPPPSSLTNYRL